MIRRVVGPALACLAVLALTGCGLVTLMHDSVLGPVSPVGRVNAVTVGTDFRVTDTGPVAELGNDARLRPVPRDMIRRMAMPNSYWALAQFFEFALSSFSFVADREVRVGRAPDVVLPEKLHPGVPVGDALALLGPPDVWVRRSGGSFMIYRGVSEGAWSLYVGVPPPVGWFVPIPFITSLRYSYKSERERATKLMLFFDERDVLVSTSASVDESGGPR